jgi:DNA-binding beta-propeller fold protein YncE
MPAGVSARSVALAGTPAALKVVDGSNLLYVADTSGLVWRFEDGQPVLTRPISLSGEPRGLDVDQSAGRLYVSVRSPPRVLVVDGTTGHELASAALAGAPGEVRLSGSTGKLFVLLPEAEALEVLDVHDLARVQVVAGLPHVTGIALDESAHALYLSHLSGDVSVVDTDAGTVTDRLSLTGPGLSGIAAAHGVVYAINTPGQVLLAVDMATRAILHVPLASEPSAVTVSPTTGVPFVLESARRAIVRLDASDGTPASEVRLADTPPELGASPSLELDQLWLLPRLAISSVDETIYVIEPGPRFLSTAGANSMTTPYDEAN